MVRVHADNLDAEGNLRKKKLYSKKKVYLVIFLFLLCLFGIGYAYLTSNLFITGSANISKNTWDVHFENVVLGTGNVEGAIAPTISADKTKVDFSTTLHIPGDRYEFTVDVVNSGTIPAMMNQIVINGLSDSQKRYLNYLVEYAEGTAIGNKDALPVGAKETIHVLIRYKEDVQESELPTTDETLNLSIAMTYLQDDGSSSPRPAYTEYKESLLNGAYPVLDDSLIAVTIENDGTVKRANLGTAWYKYEEKKWANAVILKDDTLQYSAGEVIPEANIESYFVWIPRYRYKLWNVDNVANTGVDTSMVHAIEIEFESKSTPAYMGNSNGTWLTHPAFTSFDVNGMWVGKFETGYDGAANAGGAQKNTTESNKIVIKPNVYSWREIQVANAFYTSYNYQRNLDSHMMKNTEWGAVSYLSHSKYGQGNKSIRINNNSSYKTGYAAVNEPTVDYPDYKDYGTATSVTQPWNTTTGYLASTTGNITGVYDMAGGAHEYVMGVQLAENGLPLSGRHNVYNSGFNGILGCPTCDSTLTGINSSITEITNGKTLPSTKYYDVYPVNSNGNRANRILGDATGEMGPFGNATVSSGTRAIGSWHSDEAWFVDSSLPWFYRGGHFNVGSGAGVFRFYGYSGLAVGYVSFRVVLAF